MYLYANHMGGYYDSSHEMDYDDLYCETCGDSDTLIGEYETEEERERLIEEWE